jgi:methionyl-tRNA formyltransferase
VRLLFAGTPEVALPSLAALLASPDHEVVAVLTRPDAPAGRGRWLTPSPVKQVALDAGVEVLTPTRPSEPAFQERLAELTPDICAVVAYGALVPAAALAVPEHGWVNLHFSVLPSWRGAAPVQRAILAGDDVTGATTFRLVEALDAGPVYGVMTTTVGERETAGELLGRLADDGATLLVATLDGIEDGTVTAVEQPADGVSLAPKITPDDARVRWQTAAEVVDRTVRACTPAPGAWTTVREQRLGLGPVRPRPAAERLEPGALAAADGAVLVGTGTAPVELGTVHPSGRPAMPAADWLRGARFDPADRLA